MMRLTNILFLAMLLHGCGSKSALYLPKAQPAASVSAPTPSQSDQPRQPQ